jgi:uncharacterized delta-60 repeat protein
MRHFFVLTALCLNILYSHQSYSQLQVSWFNSYIARSFNLESLKIKSDQKGNTYIAGRRFNSVAGYFVSKFRDNGQLQWTNIYIGDGNFSYATDVAIDDSGNVFITGESLESSDNWDAVTIKYNSAGVQQWINKFDAGGGELGFAITVDPANQWLYIAGQKTAVFGGNDGFIQKINIITGVQVWYSVINLANHEDIRYIQTDAAGNIYVAGVSGPNNNLDFLTAKLNPSGTTLWAKRYNGTGNGSDVAKGLAVSSDGEVTVTGSSVGSGASIDIATVRYNSSGLIKWAARYNGVENLKDEPVDIAIDGDQNTFITGFTTQSGNLMRSLTLKYDKSGEINWYDIINFFDPNIISSGNSVITDKDGSAYIAGFSANNNQHDILIAKYNSTGNRLWEYMYDHTQGDEAKHIFIDNDGGIYAAGNVNTGMFGIFAMKLLPSGNDIIIQSRGHKPDKFRLYQNYPNPFNPDTKITFDIPNPGFVKITIFNITGQIISIPVTSFLNSGTYEIQLGSNVFPSSGVYFFRLDAGVFSEIKKMVLVK